MEHYAEGSALGALDVYPAPVQPLALASRAAPFFCRGEIVPASIPRMGGVLENRRTTRDLVAIRHGRCVEVEATPSLRAGVACVGSLGDALSSSTAARGRAVTHGGQTDEGVSAHTGGGSARQEASVTSRAMAVYHAFKGTAIQISQCAASRLGDPEEVYKPL